VDSLSDEQLVSLAQRGNTAAFNRLSSRWESSVYRYALKVLRNREDAKDVCQEALTKAYLNISRLREGSKFKSWIHHIALNLCRDRFRSAGASAEHRAFDDEGPDESRVAVLHAQKRSPELDTKRSRLADLLDEVLAKLPDEQRSAILLREYHGFTSEEIAEITGVPAATVRTRIFYGLRSVRRHLEARGYN
jgi:RNA polymerase sigma-70 factor (ECF subfamily)